MISSIQCSISYADHFCLLYIQPHAERHGAAQSKAGRFLEPCARCLPFSEVLYYSESGQLNLPRYEVQFEIKIFYLPLQQIERLYKGFCY